MGLATFVARGFSVAGIVAIFSLGALGGGASAASEIAVLPQAGRSIFLKAFAEARREIRIEICVLEDPEILAGLKQALLRGVRVRAVVDNGKYQALQAEQANLATYLTAAGGVFHLSNPIFPRSFPKVILIDDRKALIGSACLDTTTFQQYRDYEYLTDDAALIRALSELFENDWRFSSTPDLISPPFNPTPRIYDPRLAIGPVNAGAQLTSLIQSAQSSLDVTSELLGNAALESELVAATLRGVRVRLISPIAVNGATPKIADMQTASLMKLKAAGISVHVTGPTESFQSPYMHARSMVVDQSRLYIGSISFSPDSSTFNREVGLVISDAGILAVVSSRFELDYQFASRPY